MTEIVRFEMSGRRFEIDAEAPPTLLDFDVLAETRVDLGAAGALLQAVARGERQADADAVRAVGALAYLAATRAGSSESWREFARAMDPATLRFVGETPPAAGPVPVPAPDLDVLAEGILRALEQRKAGGDAA